MKKKDVAKKMGKKYDVEKGSATWRHKMREAYKGGDMEAPDKFKLKNSQKGKQSLNSTGKNEGENMEMGKNNTQRA